MQGRLAYGESGASDSCASKRNYTLIGAPGVSPSRPAPPMWGKAARFSATGDDASDGDDMQMGSPVWPAAGGSAAAYGESGASDDDDILIGSPGVSPSRPPRRMYTLSPQASPSAAHVSPPRAGGLHRALRELSAMRHAEDSPAAAAAGGSALAQKSVTKRDRRLASLTAGGSPDSPPAGAGASFGSDEAYEMDDFEIDHDSSGSAEFDAGALQRVASVQTASPGSAASPASADWAEDIEEDSLVGELVEEIADSGELIDELAEADDMIVEDIFDEELGDGGAGGGGDGGGEHHADPAAEQIRKRPAGQRPRGGGASERKSTAFAAAAQAPDEVIKWLEYENAQVGAAEPLADPEPPPRSKTTKPKLGRGGKQLGMRSKRPTIQSAGSSSDESCKGGSSDDSGGASMPPANPSLVTELSARLASLDVSAQRTLLQTLQDLDGNPTDRQSAHSLAALRLLEPEPEPEQDRLLSEPVQKAPTVPEQGPEESERHLGSRTAATTKPTQRVRLRLISNWGGDRQIGLSAVECFDSGSNLIQIASSDVSVRGVRGDKGQPSRLLKRTSAGPVSELDMWLCARPAPPLYPDVDILISADVVVSQVRVYNYGAGNSSGKEVREMELFVGEQRRWQGVLNRAGRDGGNFTDIPASKLEPAAAVAHVAPTQLEVSRQEPVAAASAAMEPALAVEDPNLRRGSSLWFGGDVQQAKAKSAAAEAATAAMPRRRRNIVEPTAAEQDADAIVAYLDRTTPADSTAVAPKDASWDSGSDADEPADDVLGELEGRGEQFGRRAAKSEVQESWDSLTLFRKHNRARLDNTDDLVAASDTTQVNVDAALEAADDLASYIDELDTLVSAAAGTPAATAVQPAEVEPEAFSISCLPSGLVLDLDIKTTWGDRYYVGLCGLELFDGDGEKIRRSALAKVEGKPSGMNDLPGYTNDPREVDNLFDGVNRTTDAFHLWLAPFTPGASHVVTVHFVQAVTLSMIRVWNYNESRTSVARGARHVEICLDKTPVFRGEISQAPGVLDGSEDDAECIFLTSDASLLKAIETAVESESESARREIEVDVELTQVARPTTSGSHRAAAQTGESELFQDVSKTAAAAAAAAPVVEVPIETPLSAADMAAPPPQVVAAARSRDSALAAADDHLSAIQIPATTPVQRVVAQAKPVAATGTVVPQPQQPMANVLDPPAGACSCRKVVLRLLSTWGDPHYIGLGGVEIIGSDGRPIPSSMVASLTANPRDLHSTPGYEGDLRRLENLLGGAQGSCDDTTMWLAPFSGSAHGRNGTNVVELEFKESIEVSGIRIWNYNKDWDSSFRGAKLVRIEADGVAIQSSRPIALRKVRTSLSRLIGASSPQLTRWSFLIQMT